MTCDEVTHSIELVAGKTLLDIALQAKLDVPYSCQGGVCSSCVARVTEGEVVMTQNQILTENEVADGFILTCQAYPTTEALGIDYDDV